MRKLGLNPKKKAGNGIINPNDKAFFTYFLKKIAVQYLNKLE